MKKLNFPNGAEFAFTVLDDTDDTTVANGRPVYELLSELNIKTTKTVWAFDTAPENQGPYFAGETLSNPDYLAWVHELASQGFEIAFHNATMGSSVRNDTIKALDYLEREFGKEIRLHCNHGQNKENIYWGIHRYDSLVRKVLAISSRSKNAPDFEGHVSGSPYYWADVALARLSYMRAFTFKQLNGNNIVPGGPFRDPLKPEAPVLFNSTDAPDVNAFNERVNRKSVDLLCEQGGWAIVSTHFGKGFCSNGTVDREFKQTLRYLSTLPGWFVPVSDLLDHLAAKSGITSLTKLQRTQLELLHVGGRFHSKMTSN